MTAGEWNRESVYELWRQFVNPDYVQLLETFDFGQRYVRAEGATLWNEDGREITDFLAGFGVHNIGHNHPRLVKRLHEVLDSNEPSMLNVDASLPAALLGRRLSGITHSNLCRVAFASSGAEAVEVAIKAVRAATGRNVLVTCEGGSHGMTMGALSLMGNAEQRQGLGPLLPNVASIPFGNTAAFADVCRHSKPAAFFVEPIQGEGGIRIPPPKYLGEISQLCHKNGCLLVIDEIQTGLGRTGKMFATDFSFSEVMPDILLLGKALSGGQMPLAACMMNADTWTKAFTGQSRCGYCMSTFSGGRLAMAAGLETIDILQEEHLVERAAELGPVLLEGLKTLAAKHRIIKDVRGRGLLVGVEFEQMSGLSSVVVPQWAKQQLYVQVIAAVLLRDHGFLTQACTLSPSVLRIEPPLVITREEIEKLIDALDKVLTAYPTPASALTAAFRKAVLKSEF